MINKKVCMLGAFSVGKTSLVEKFVHSIFSDSYLSTVGVKISKKALTIEKKDVNLVLWDMEGKDSYSNVNVTYLRGAMGFFVVADVTRAETLKEAVNLRNMALELVGPLPHFLLINKVDMEDKREITDDMIQSIDMPQEAIIYTSAKTSLNVEKAFSDLTMQMISEQNSE